VHLYDDIFKQNLVGDWISIYGENENNHLISNCPFLFNVYANIYQVCFTIGENISRQRIVTLYKKENFGSIFIGENIEFC